jgi:hypothetical protein
VLLTAHSSSQVFGAHRGQSKCDLQVPPRALGKLDRSEKVRRREGLRHLSLLGVQVGLACADSLERDSLDARWLWTAERRSLNRLPFSCSARLGYSALYTSSSLTRA